VEGANAESAAMRLCQARNILVSDIWNILDAGTSSAFKVYEEHKAGILGRYDLGSRMLIGQIEHQKSICMTFALAARDRNDPYGNRWLPF